MPCIRKGHRPLAMKTVKFTLDGEDYVNVRELSSRDVIALQERFGSDAKIDAGVVGEVLCRCLVDDEGRRLFDSAEDVAEGLDVGMSTLKALAHKALEISGVEETPKN